MTIKARPLSLALVLAMLGACGSGEAPAGSGQAASEPVVTGEAPEGSDAEAQFDWEVWASVVNEHPCNWFSDSELADLAEPGLKAKPSFSPTLIYCEWTRADGTGIFQAAVHILDEPEFVAAERESQLRDARDSLGFEVLPEGNFTVSTFNPGNIIGYTFPNDKDEKTFITVAGIGLAGAGSATIEARRETVKALQSVLVNKNGL